VRPRMTSSEAMLYCMSDNDATPAVNPAARHAQPSAPQPGCDEPSLGATAAQQLAALAARPSSSSSSREHPNEGAAHGGAHLRNGHSVTNGSTGPDQQAAGAAGAAATATNGAAGTADARFTTPEFSAATPSFAFLSDTDVAALSDDEVVAYFDTLVLPEDFKMPSLPQFGYNVYAMLRAVPGLLRAHLEAGELRRSAEQARRLVRVRQRQRRSLPSTREDGYWSDPDQNESLVSGPHALDSASKRAQEQQLAEERERDAKRTRRDARRQQVIESFNVQHNGEQPRCGQFHTVQCSSLQCMN
jgi:hypothetical protein